MGVGNRVLPRAESVAAETLERFRAAAFPVANVADAMGRFGALRGLRRMAPAPYLVGTALTVRTRPSDNLMVHKALDLAGPGDVLVVDACGGADYAIVGGLMCRYARRRGLAGLVVDGMVRDDDELTELGLPVYAAGISPNGPYKDGPGEINVPVSCGRTPVLPGDLVLGDADGVVVVPRADAEQVRREAEAVRGNERGVVAAIERDGWDRAWIDRKLAANGCADG
ncbi:RraA family protein [Allonocardiopsis opalescens]|uniref:Putative 4-hydroxy-4-methyl-2-oxoglutarate aldolase n=1 Tax=Allonocardiopsis opalescens TaxID=1144618 RepID=A0A2T0QEQ7_9ACTN|nr:RraA family protein [Allonocardiopsis opalescens]PRY02409.1 RraA family protein [Allonocardiopsis opalescens]